MQKFYMYEYRVQINVHSVLCTFKLFSNYSVEFFCESIINLTYGKKADIWIYVCKFLSIFFYSVQLFSLSFIPNLCNLFLHAHTLHWDTKSTVICPQIRWNNKFVFEELLRLWLCSLCVGKINSSNKWFLKFSFQGSLAAMALVTKIDIINCIKHSLI